MTEDEVEILRRRLRRADDLRSTVHELTKARLAVPKISGVWISGNRVRLQNVENPKAPDCAYEPCIGAHVPNLADELRAMFDELLQRRISEASAELEKL